MEAGRRFQAIMGFLVIALSLGLTVDFYIANRSDAREHAALAAHIDCNRQLLEVLQVRSDARNVSDATTAEAQLAASAIFAAIYAHGSAGLNPNDPLAAAAQEAFTRAARAREDPKLMAPYPMCDAG